MTERRGIVIHPNELSETWLKDAQSLQLNVLGLHPPGGRDAARNLQKMLEDLRDPQIRRLLDRAQSMGLILEYELHAVSYLLPALSLRRIPIFFGWTIRGCARRTSTFARPHSKLSRCCRKAPPASPRCFPTHSTGITSGSTT